MVKKKEEVKEEIPKKLCTMCNKEKKTSDFYNSTSKFYSDGKSPICKACCLNNVDIYNQDSVIEMLELLDRPFIYDVWENCLKKGEKAFANYVRQINSLNQYKGLYFKHSYFTEKRAEDILDEKNEEDEEGINQITTEFNKVIKYNKKLQVKWPGYPKEEVLQLENFYQKMLYTHEITTPQHLELLKVMCKLNLKMNKALENDDNNAFTKFFQSYTKLLEVSGFRPIDKSSEDGTKGIKNFSKLFEFVEKKGFIKPAPIEENQDKVDLTIMYILNYYLKLLNMNQLKEPPLDVPRGSDED